MKLRILGSGTSSGVPRIGPDWGACDPTDPRNRRTRASLLIEHGGYRVLIDTSPDLREQLLRAGVATVDAVIWTHDHADHCHGIDDLRQVFHARGRPVPCYARPDVLATLTRRFGYIFSGRSGYPAVVEAHELGGQVTLGGIDITTVDQPHGTISSVGLRFDAAGRAAAYATDFHELTPAMRALYTGLDVWILDALRHAPHPSHPTVTDALGWVAELRPGRAALIHMDHTLDYTALAAMLPASVEPGHDGLEFAL